VSSFPLFPKRPSELIVFGKEKNGKKKWLCDSPWIEKLLENWLIFAKTEKPVWIDFTGFW
jgi:hypothetical protein